MEELAEPALRRALKNEPTAEVRQQIEKLLERLTAPAPSAQRLRQLRGVEVLERLATPEARKLLEELAAGDGASRLTREAKSALARLPEPKR